MLSIRTTNVVQGAHHVPVSRLLITAATALTTALSTPASLFAQEVSVRSEVRPYNITALQELPHAPATAHHNCTSPAPVSPAARTVTALGWQVVHESDLGPFHAVTFVGQSNSGSAGMCAYGESNVAIYRGDTLEALIWAAFEEEIPIIMGVSIEDRLLRLYAADYVNYPVADLVLAENDTLVLRELPKIDRYCSGKVPLPVGWGESLKAELSALDASGWSARSAEQGKPAPDECSGSGVGYCVYMFDHEGAELKLTTYGGEAQGNGPAIADYEVTCKPL